MSIVFAFFIFFSFIATGKILCNEKVFKSAYHTNFSYFSTIPAGCLYHSDKFFRQPVMCLGTENGYEKVSKVQDRR